ncbi:MULTISPECIES: response regulator [unclassified Rhizobium]|uniref:response regulator n=1 Tax=unclassified Rhizobium TaxID=2613769 RepID=UPI0017A9DA22|nr:MULTISPECIES: response regulator [unclassified Rhizobium]MBB3539318.1 FixJ family two-component response regulator [Rhizobium sp. BK399]MCS3741292.1 FixJ family two-component response regulator [Rhizobium sp. BK661]MCS4093456.1 FixJ family two-component response regulator [Rhizobium sp. BK176]
MMVDLRALISVVDDDVSVRESLSGLLGSLGFDVETFSSANDFLRSPRIAEVECIVLDVAMPVMSGPELFQSMISSGRDIPIVFITGVEDEILRDRLISMGAIDCLYKPLCVDELRKAVASALHR